MEATHGQWLNRNVVVWSSVIPGSAQAVCVWESQLKSTITQAASCLAAAPALSGEASESPGLTLTSNEDVLFVCLEGDTFNIFQPTYTQQQHSPVNQLTNSVCFGTKFMQNIVETLQR